MKTQDIYDLVQEVLHSIPRPYPNDIIDLACRRIESNRQWMNRYTQLVAIHRKPIVNQMIGRHLHVVRFLPIWSCCRSKQLTEKNLQCIDLSTGDYWLITMGFRI